MALIYDTKTTPYLTPQLEFEQLSKNTGVVGLGPNVSLASPSSPVLFRTTGNGIIYLEGGNVLAGGAGLPLNSVLLILPEAIARKNSTAVGVTFLIPALSPGGDSLAFVGRIGGNLIQTVDVAGIPAFTSLYFGGISYFTDKD